ncbi:hypothetical protein H3N56_11260 [Cetobacterium sp. 2A]|uniref:hypothetical protein n=1 Tax=Cetobacterium sp. 2A TaxID=2754723 RepID=UPI00163D21BC|nr:hypothetical protein [Cetobacterium sp. 2A]MBC2857011.1 hypothetical protein [Cetobacterium sp. 2A]
MNKIFVLFILVNILSFSNATPIIPAIPSTGNTDMEVPKLPNSDKTEKDGSVRKLLSNTTVMIESKLNVVVPLEIISDIDIKAMVVDDERVEVPFSFELNKTPDIQNHYKVKYSEDKIDIDKDGKIDTYIYSPKFLNKRIIDDNMVVIEGENISKDGVHEKKIYMTIEVKQ